jgi:hypothetical protein
MGAQAADAQQEAQASKGREAEMQGELHRVQQQLARVQQEVELKEAVLAHIQQEKEATAARCAACPACWPPSCWLPDCWPRPAVGLLRACLLCSCLEGAFLLHLGTTSCATSRGAKR